MLIKLSIHRRDVIRFNQNKSADIRHTLYAHHKPEYTMEKSAPKGTNPNVYSLALSVSRW